MAESVQYLALDLGTLEAGLLGESPHMQRAIGPLLAPLTDGLAAELARKLQTGEPIAWTEEPLRRAPWDIHAQLSAFIARAWRLNGDFIAFDAWPDARRVQFVLADWYPLDRDFGARLAARPSAVVAFEQPDRLNAAQWTALVESYPHGFLLRDELDDAITGLHRLLGDLHARLAGIDPGSELSPLALRPPGTALDAEARSELFDLDDGSVEGWQVARAAVLYDAACAVLPTGRDLVMVGY